MTFDNEALEEKKAEVANVADEAMRFLGIGQDPVTARAAQAFARLTPPTLPEVTFERITLESLGRDGGSSRKPGNIFLHWQKLMALVPDATIAVAGAVTAPAWLLPFIGLYVWNKLWCSAKEELSEAEATTILALWKNKDASNRISCEDGYKKTNLQRHAMHLPELSWSAYNDVINRLLRMECIKMTDGVIWLREWVCISY